MQTLSIVADVISLFSFLVSALTFISTLRVRRALIRHVEASGYREEIEESINNLTSYYETMKKDLYNKSVLDMVDDELDNILNSYEEILPNEIVSRIKKLQKHMKNKCYCNINDRDAKRECEKQIRSICVRLRREKKIL